MTDGKTDSDLPAAGEEEADIDALARTLIRDLELGEGPPTTETRDLNALFAPFLSLHPKSFARIGLDAAVTAGISGDWNLSLRLVARLLQNGDERLGVKLWELRCLVECGRFAEALASSQAVPWDRTLLIHVNYLTGLAYESLGMREQAQLRFDAVRRQNPSYKDIRFRP